MGGKWAIIAPTAPELVQSSSFRLLASKLNSTQLKSASASASASSSARAKDTLAFARQLIKQQINFYIQPRRAQSQATSWPDGHFIALDWRGQD